MNTVSRKAPLLFYFLSLPLTTTLAAEVPYPLEEDTDDEYPIDLVAMEADRDWAAAWRTSDSGVRVDMGSLNVRQWRMVTNVKLAADFTSWLRFYYRYDRVDGLEPLTEERNVHELEMEFRPYGRWYAGVRALPTFWKKDADAGLSLKYRRDRYNHFEVRYTFIDFDNNYAFEKSSYDQGFREYYAVPARRLEFEGAFVMPGAVEVRGGGFLRPASVKHHRFYYGQASDYTRRFSENNVWIETEFSPFAEWGLWFNYTKDRWNDKVMYPAESRAGDYDALLSLDYLRSEVRRRTAGRHSFRGGAWLRVQERNVTYPNDPPSGYDYSKTDVAYYGLWRIRAVADFYVETGYSGMRTSSSRKSRTERPPEEKSAWENRIPVAIEYKFTDRLRFRMSSGVELDHTDWGRYFAYDKAFASVIACL
jgi:hypothetical protein